MRKYKVYYAPVKVTIRKPVNSQQNRDISQQIEKKDAGCAGYVGSTYINGEVNMLSSQSDLLKENPLNPSFGETPNPEIDPPTPGPTPNPDPPTPDPPDPRPTPPTPGGSLVSGTMYFGLRFQSNFVSMDNLYKKLGLQTLEELNKLPTGQTRPPTCIELSNQSDGIKLGLLKTFEITLVPKDETKKLPPYDDKYITHVPASGTFTNQKVAEALYKAEFKFPSTPDPISYIVQPGSVKLVRGRKNTGKINLF